VMYWFCFSHVKPLLFQDGFQLVLRYAAATSRACSRA
jgi:hypothetical protein